MNPHLRRLEADKKEIEELANNSDRITILGSEGNPPNKYLLQLDFKSIEKINNDGQPVFGYSHKLKIEFSPNYPSYKPYFAFATPVFHPNVAKNGDVCFGKKYSPGNSISEIITRIIEFIRWNRNYIGMDSPFNLDAYEWARKNMSLIGDGLDTSQIENPVSDVDDDKSELTIVNILPDEEEHANEEVFIRCLDKEDSFQDNEEIKVKILDKEDSLHDDEILVRILNNGK